jgi:hypothetical protein
VHARLLCLGVRRAKKRGRRASVSDAAYAPLFPPEEICAQAQGNAAAWILTVIAYLKEHGGAVEDCVSYHGRSFAPAWEALRGSSVEEVAQLVALNVLSVGSTLRSLSSEEGRTEMLVEGWPDEELLGLLPLDRDECDQIWDTYRPIMEHLGLSYAWQRQDDVVRLVVERQSGR